MRQISLSICCCLLAACASVGPPQSKQPFLTDRAWFGPAYDRFQQTDAWTMRGRIAVRFDGKGETGRIHWQNAAGKQVIRINGPFGAGAVELTIDAFGARIRDSKGNTRQALSAERLLLDQTGWYVPVEDLRYWLNALPGPRGDIRYRLSPENELAELYQGAWIIEYTEYAEYTKLRLPRRITATEQGNSDTRVRLVITDWERR